MLMPLMSYSGRKTTVTAPETVTVTKSMSTSIMFGLTSIRSDWLPCLEHVSLLILARLATLGLRVFNQQPQMTVGRG